MNNIPQLSDRHFQWKHFVSVQAESQQTEESVLDEFFGACDVDNVSLEGVHLPSNIGFGACEEGVVKIEITHFEKYVEVFPFPPAPFPLYLIDSFGTSGESHGKLKIKNKTFILVNVQEPR